MTVEVKNYTPFANLRYSNTLHDGREFGILMLKATFDIAENGICSLSEEQEPINFKDRFHGELNITSLSHPSEFVPWKPGTDVIINATAYAPDGVPHGKFLAGIQITNEQVELNKIVNVTGPRHWIPKWKTTLSSEEKQNWKEHLDQFDGWELSGPEPILSLDIRYEYAFGGTIPKGLDDDGIAILDAHEYNPVGCGLLDENWTDHTVKQPAPQIESPEDPITDPKKIYFPQGLGPIPAAWLPRRPLGGTYDQSWVDEIWPRWPADYKFSFHHSAARGLNFSPRIIGDFELLLANLHPRISKFRIYYKDLLPHALFYPDDSTGGHGQRYLLDTIHISDDLTQIFLVWRTLYDLRIDQSIEIWTCDQGAALSYEHVRNNFASELHPEEFAFDLEKEEHLDA